MWHLKEIEVRGNRKKAGIAYSRQDKFPFFKLGIFRRTNGFSIALRYVLIEFYRGLIEEAT